MTKNKQPIKDTLGSVELLDFPEYGKSEVPSRVDTGAIYSSIWATDVVEKEGKLYFKLFGPGSALYSGEVITADDFRTSSVTSSFGQSEFRYKIRLQVRLGGRKIRAWFTLSDRSSMTYPVLVGRNVLRSKFIVDVSKRKTHSSRPGEVLVLASEGHDFDEYFRGVEKRSRLGTKYLVRDYKDLIFSIASGQVNVTETISGRDIGSFDVIYFKSHKRDYPFAIAAAQYAQYRGVKVVDQELLTHVSYDKLSEYMHLALHNLPIPYTFCAPTEYLLKNIESIADITGWPLVCKEIEADKGRKNYVLDDSQELKEVLEEALDGDTYVIQPYIPNDGFIRALVLDRDVAMAIHRSTIERDDKRKRHLNKLPNAGNVTLLELSELDPRVHDLSVRASVTMNRQVAGVDILQDTDSKEWFIIEANNAPQLKSGPFLEEREKAIAAFIDKQLQ